MKQLRNYLFVFFIFIAYCSLSVDSAILVRYYGIKVNVLDMDKAILFYNGQLGFEIENRDYYPNQVWIKANDNNKFVLNRVSNLVPLQPFEARAEFTLQVNDLDSAIARMRTKGVSFAETQKRKEGVGYAISIVDPFGTTISMMHETVVQNPHFKEPRIYNSGFLISNMDSCRKFYSEKLGFVERSQKYLPLDMPMGHIDKTFAFMLHYREGIEPIKFNSANDEHVVILHQTKDLEKTMAALGKRGVRFVQRKIQMNGLGRFISFYDPYGYVSELIEVK